MTVESATYINELVPANTNNASDASEGDDHIALIKTVLQATFPNVTGAVNATQAEMNALDGLTATVAELNILDGVTATAAELNILDGVTATTAELNILDGVTATAAELNTLDGITSTVTELNLLDGITAILDEDNMVSNSATALATQQSIKAYVDGIDFATQSYVDARSLVQVTASTYFAGAAAFAMNIPVGVTGTITRVDAAIYLFGSDSVTVALKTAADQAISSHAFSSVTNAIDSQTSPTNTSVAPGDMLKVTSAGSSTNNGTIVLTITVDIS